MSAFDECFSLERTPLHVFGLNIPSFCASGFAGSCFNVRYFFVKTQRLSDRFVYAHITRGLVASSLQDACRAVENRDGNPSGAIIVSAHTDIPAKEERFVMR